MSADRIEQITIEITKAQQDGNIRLAFALRYLKAGCYVFPTLAGKKEPNGLLAPNGFLSASNDPEQIKKWWADAPDSGIGIDLGRSGLTVLDFDNGLPPAELNLPDTLQVSTARGTHVYFLGVSEQGKMYFSNEHCGEIKSAGGYVVGATSKHPSGTVYTVTKKCDIVDLPAGLVDRLRVSKKDGEFKKNPEGWLDEPFIHGEIHDQLVKVAGYYIGINNITDADALYALLIAKLEKNGCFEEDRITPYQWHSEDVRKVADNTVKTMKAGIRVALAQGQPLSAAVVAPTAEIDDTEVGARPVFPRWVLTGTSLYEGLVKPALDANPCKHEQFILMPAIQLFLNCLSVHVTVGFNKTNHNIFLGLISPYGHFFKSSSCELAHQYFNLVGLSTSFSKDTRATEGKVMIAQAGSSEGFGLMAERTNTRHAILYNDELAKLVAKAGIESSSFSSDLLQWYESADFANNTKNIKTGFNFKAKEYTFGWCWCTTDRSFNRLWPKLAGISSGLEDRMFFVIGPEKPKETVPEKGVDLAAGSIKTRQLIDKAIRQKKYEFEDTESYARSVAGLDPRSMGLVEKLALYFCVDMGCEVIDQEHIDRAVALVKYRNQTAKFLAPIEADNQQGRLQKEMVRELRKYRGKMKYRDLCLNLDFSRYGVDVWKRAYTTMVGEGILADFKEETTAGKRASRMTALLKLDD